MSFVLRFALFVLHNVYMTLKTCTCKKVVTTKTAKRVIRIKDDDTMAGLYFNCGSCNSTLFIQAPKLKQKAV